MAIKEDIYKDILDNLYDGVYFVDRERRITYWNKAAERITGYSSSEVLGRRCADNVLIHVDGDGNLLCDSCCPLADTLLDGRLRSADVYLLHKDGHRIPISLRVAPIRNDSGGIVGAAEIFTDNTVHANTIARMAEFERLAYIDPLTGIANRRYAEMNLFARHEEMHRYGWPFGVVFIDIDRFKDINDKYGHQVGDEVLKMVAKTLVNSVRSFDVIGRWGGEEFIVILANINIEELKASSNRFRALIERSRIPGMSDLKVTVSIGATLARPEETPTEIVRRADMLMYKSKERGRNCVTVEA